MIAARIPRGPISVNKMCIVSSLPVQWSQTNQASQALEGRSVWERRQALQENPIALCVFLSDHSRCRGDRFTKPRVPCWFRNILKEPDISAPKLTQPTLHR